MIGCFFTPPALATISRCTRDRQGTHPQPCGSPHAFAAVGLPAYHQEVIESGRSLSGSQPSYGIRSDPLPAALRSGLAGDRQRFFQPMMALQMALVEHKPEAVPG